MTCFEKLKLDNPDLTEREIGDIMMYKCPNTDCGIPIPDPEYCNGVAGSCCAACWVRQIPGTETPPVATETAENVLKIMLDPGAIMPTRAHKADAGMDLYSRESFKLYPGESHKFDTGVHVAIPEGYVGMVKSRSGLNVNHGITSEGVIDSGYTGSIMVKLYNHGEHSVLIEKGEKISQLVILPIATPFLLMVDSLGETERGNGGFGSTGKF